MPSPCSFGRFGQANRSRSYISSQRLNVSPRLRMAEFRKPDPKFSRCSHATAPPPPGVGAGGVADLQRPQLFCGRERADREDRLQIPGWFRNAVGRVGSLADEALAFAEFARQQSAQAGRSPSR